MPITLTETNDTPGPEGVPLHGTAERLVEVLTDYAAAGLQHLLMFNLCEPGETVEQIERIASEVLPEVKGLVGRGAA